MGASSRITTTCMCTAIYAVDNSMQRQFYSLTLGSSHLLGKRRVIDEERVSHYLTGVAIR